MRQTTPRSATPSPTGLLCLCLSLLLLAACGTPRNTTARAQTVPLQVSSVLPPGFGDSDPHDWQGRRPQSYPVHGIDVSRWQGEIDWRTARASGVNFAFIKATEGGDSIDPAFATNWDRAAQAGVVRGAYHFYYFCTPAAVQARWFIANVPRSPGALPPVLDLEWNHRSPTCRTRPPGATVRSEARIFLDILTQHYGQRPIIYTTPDFWVVNDIGSLGEEVWLRSVADHPRVVYPGASWSFWQYSGTGIVPGLRGAVDLNVFAGTPDGWRNWLNQRRQR